MGVVITISIKSRINHKGVFIGNIELEAVNAMLVPEGMEVNCPLYIQKQDNIFGKVSCNVVSEYDQNPLKTGSILRITSKIAAEFQMTYGISKDLTRFLSLRLYVWSVKLEFIPK